MYVSRTYCRLGENLVKRRRPRLTHAWNTQMMSKYTSAPSTLQVHLISAYNP